MIIFTTKVTFLKCLILMCFLSWKFENVNLDRMVKGKKGNGKRKQRTVKRSNTSLKDLSKVLEDHGRHSMLSFLSSLPISVLRILDTEANKFYDRNHQLYYAHS